MAVILDQGYVREEQALTDEPVVASVAVAAAERLATELGQPRLLSYVQAAISSTGTGEQARQFVDPLALGSLIVSIAGLAWQIYSDRKKEGSAPTRETLTRIVCIQRRGSSNLSRAEETIIEAVSAEVIKAAGDDK
jgi:hypothetical protein